MEKKEKTSALQPGAECGAKKEYKTKFAHPLHQKGGIYFYAGSITKRKNVFVTPEYINLLVNAFKYSELKKDIKNLAYVIMPNFFYWIFKLSETQDDPVNIFGEVKRDVAREVVNNLKMETKNGDFQVDPIMKGNERVARSSPQRILATFAEEAKKYENKRYRVWTPKTELRLIDSPELLQEKLAAVQKAPSNERWQIVKDSKKYPYLYLAEDLAALSQEELKLYSANLVSQVVYTMS